MQLHTNPLAGVEAPAWKAVAVAVIKAVVVKGEVAATIAEVEEADNDEFIPSVLRVRHSGHHVDAVNHRGSDRRFWSLGLLLVFFSPVIGTGAT